MKTIYLLVSLHGNQRGFDLARVAFECRECAEAQRALNAKARVNCQVVEIPLYGHLRDAINANCPVVRHPGPRDRVLCEHQPVTVIG